MKFMMESKWHWWCNFSAFRNLWQNRATHASNHRLS